MSRKVELPKDKIIELYQQGIGCGKIASLLNSNTNRSTIRQYLKFWGVALRSREIATSLSNSSYRRTQMTNDQHQILTGIIISDGCLHVTNGCRNAHLSFSSTEPEYAKFIQHTLPFEFFKMCIEPPKKDVNICGHMYNTKAKYHVQSTVDLTLTDYYNDWYADGRKKVPETLQLTPLMLTHWFYGDGSTSFSNNKNRVHLTFCTNSFSKYECDMLIEKFHSFDNDLQFGLVIDKKYRPNKTKTHHLIKASKRKTVQCFFEHIKPYFNLECFNYKWKLPEPDYENL
jgi:hypothetical protein